MSTAAAFVPYVGFALLYLDDMSALVKPTAVMVDSQSLGIK